MTMITPSSQKTFFILWPVIILLSSFYELMWDYLSDLLSRTPHCVRACSLVPPPLFILYATAGKQLLHGRQQPVPFIRAHATVHTRPRR